MRHVSDRLLVRASPTLLQLTRRCCRTALILFEEAMLSRRRRSNSAVYVVWTVVCGLAMGAIGVWSVRLAVNVLTRTVFVRNQQFIAATALQFQPFSVRVNPGANFKLPCGLKRVLLAVYCLGALALQLVAGFCGLLLALSSIARAPAAHVSHSALALCIDCVSQIKYTSAKELAKALTLAELLPKMLLWRVQVAALILTAGFTGGLVSCCLFTSC